MKEMNYFENLIFEKGIITVLGTDIDSDFVINLSRFLSYSGSVEVSECFRKEQSTDYLVVVPDKNADRWFVMHSEEETERFRASDYVLGIISVDILEKSIEEAVLGAKDFAVYTDKNLSDRIHPSILADVIELHEKYDYLYINKVANEGQRYHARELARRHRRGTGVRMINTDNNYVEVLIRPNRKG